MLVGMQTINNHAVQMGVRSRLLGVLVYPRMLKKTPISLQVLLITAPSWEKPSDHPVTHR